MKEENERLEDEKELFDVLEGKIDFFSEYANITNAQILKVLSDLYKNFFKREKLSE